MPLLISYDGQFKAAKVVMQRDLYYSFPEIFPFDQFFDIVTPYGYGGFLIEGELSVQMLQLFKEEYYSFLYSQNIISEFTRFHPLIQNHEIIREVMPIIELGSTVSMDLRSEEVIWENILSKNRNMIRKAQKSGIIIKQGNSSELYAKFKEIYDGTMVKDNADSYYFFGAEFYESIMNDLKDNARLFYAEYKTDIIAMAIILYANNKMHYHLSGSLPEYRNLAPSNLLLYEAALWGCRQGFKTFHLGGGLYKFKKAFNKNSSHKFAIGKYIINQEKYNQLVAYRQKSDPTFNKESNFFPLYRA
jgi:lipid II:glycine glycyltransferase (peptidoglycan interpeptide bridge formation enzyme)